MSARAEHELVVQAAREHAPCVLGALVRRHGDFASAEDAVQEALLSAFVEWTKTGVPANPGGWLFQVASRRMIDTRESERARRRREEIVFLDAPAETADDFTQADALEDDTLMLLYLCCHPALTPPSAIALTLRAVGGLTTTEIASAFLVPEATMAQRISRAKSTIEESGAEFAPIDASERERRLENVMRVLYLIFNEGYTASGGTELVRVDLSTEAIRLARALHASVPEDAEAAGLLALMILTDARRAARTGPIGELIPLDEQDRGLWDRAAITEGTKLLEATLARGAVGEYQIQAAIAAVHDEAPRAQDTDWAQILALYGLLGRMNDSPMVALNRAIATAMVHGPQVGLALLDELESDERLRRNHRLTAARAHLLMFAGDRSAAIANFRLAAERTTSTPERDYLLTKAARLASG
jgi:RNA polymerase sigma factor (sigma-70 family)